MKIHNNKRKRRIDEDGVHSQMNNLSQYSNSLSLADKYNKIC